MYLKRPVMNQYHLVWIYKCTVLNHYTCSEINKYLIDRLEVHINTKVTIDHTSQYNMYSKILIGGGGV